jgi:Protein of unknown function (DUF3572)
MKSSHRQMTLDAAETLALHALAFIAAEPARLTSFVEETGISLDQLHINATRPTTLLSVLEALLRDEPNLLMFTANAGLEPDAVARAGRAIEQAIVKGEQS